MTPEPTPAPPDEEAIQEEWLKALEAAEKEAAAQEAAEREAANAPPPPPPPARRGWRPGPKTLAAACLLVGVGTGVGVRVRTAPPPEDEVVQTPDAEPDDPLGARYPAAALAERIDDAIRAGDFGRALKAVRTAPRGAAKRDGGSLNYREALCLEALGRHAEAAKAYQAAAGDDPKTSVWPWAVLGQARTAAASGDLPAARTFLARVVLRSGRTPGLLAECLHTRGLIAVHALGLPAFPDPLDPTDPAWPPADARLLEAAGRLLPRGGGEDSEPDDQPVRVWTWWRTPERYEVTARLPAATAGDLLHAVAAAAGLRLTLDPDIAPKLSGLPAAVDVDGVPLAELVAAVADPAGAGWRVRGDELVVEPPAPASVEGTRAAAEAALERAAALAPDHPLGRPARVGVANLRLLAGRPRQAEEAYRRLIAEAPRAADCVVPAFNLGLLDIRDGRPGARARFLDVVDRADRGSRWVALAKWWVGRADMDAGDAGRAARSLRAVPAGGPELASAVTLGLALCHLAADDREAAAAELKDQKIGRADRHQRAAAAVKTLLRYRAAPTDLRAKDAAEAVGEAKEWAAFGPLGPYFAGQAYVELGRPDRMVATYEAAADRHRTPLAPRMTLAVADHYAEAGDADRARSRYLVVAATDPDGLGPRAQLRVAEMAARAGRGADVVRLTRPLVGRPGVDREEVLAVLGRGYELEGQFRQAAFAFAGGLPPE